MQHAAPTPGSGMPNTQRLADLLSVIHAEEKLLRELGSEVAAIAVATAPRPDLIAGRPDDFLWEWHGFP
ncbi:hypothetical protein [Nocardia macrotermitis]|uniref:Uncharacterized protein n=1 Tax=Nocardia macrotermitis TaxID=2585198 RepID=A0A7K0CY09_9NOCA|nr:hypothetical protein [Nocardia macrotermitis]MQY18366.1 hypothetical protein [Nocardia macrotermitis]